MLKQARQRSLRLWNTLIVPDLDVGQQRHFERALADVGMRAGISIPTVFGFGYSFGAACHALAGGAPERRDEAAATVGLYMFIMGVFDHLLDEYPAEFGDLGKIINAASLEQWTIERVLDGLKTTPDKVLAHGLLQLHRVYFMRCHRLLDRSGDSRLAKTWLEALRELYRVEHESVERRISKVKPSEALIRHAERPSSDGFWGLGVTACLGEGEVAARRIEKFARDFGRLTWYVDDAADIEKDIRADIWSGLAIRLALHAMTQKQAEEVAQQQAEDAGAIIKNICQALGDARWQPEDTFTLADMLWAHLWSWLGGTAPAVPQQRTATGRD